MVDDLSMICLLKLLNMMIFQFAVKSLPEGIPEVVMGEPPAEFKAAVHQILLRGKPRREGAKPAREN